MSKNIRLNKLCIHLCLVAALVSSCSQTSDFQETNKLVKCGSKSLQAVSEIQLEPEQRESNDRSLLSYSDLIEIALSELNTLRSALTEDIANQTDLEAQDELKALEDQYFAGYAEDGRAIYGRELTLAKAALLIEKYRAAAAVSHRRHTRADDLY